MTHTCVNVSIILSRTLGHVILLQIQIAHQLLPQAAHNPFSLNLWHHNAYINANSNANSRHNQLLTSWASTALRKNTNR